MPTKMPKAKIHEVEPTEEELSAAKKVLKEANAAGRRSKNAGMIHFLKSSPDELVSMAKGTQRDAYLEKFIVLQMRYSKGERTVTATREVGTNFRKLRGLALVESGADGPQPRC